MSKKKESIQHQIGEWVLAGLGIAFLGFSITFGLLGAVALATKLFGT